MKKGFTLAEVLITLGIIGVVAALTIPSIIQKQIEKQTVVKLEKAYSTLLNAYQLAQYEYGEEFRRDLDWSNCNSYKRPFIEKLMPYLDVAIDCQDNLNACFRIDAWKGSYYTKLNKTGSACPASSAAVVLKDGTLIAILQSGYCAPHVAHTQILVDVNGKKEPNTYGHDVFLFYISGFRRTASPGYDGKLSPGYGKATCSFTSSQMAVGCAGWVLRNKNMDYLHCDLDWNTQTKCK